MMATIALCLKSEEMETIPQAAITNAASLSI